MADQSRARQGERQGQELATRGGEGERGLATRRYHDPFTAFDELFDRLQRQMFGASLFGALMPERGSEGERAPLPRTPRMEFRDTGNAITLRAELPGLGRDDVTVECRGDVLVIQGEKREEQGDGGQRSERYVSFYRQLPLPDEVDPEQCKASFDNGVLTLEFPKQAARQESRRIPITSGPEGQEKGESKGARAA
jgi:HSP20 family protein